MKRKEFFNVGLYIESLRRIRLPAIIFTVILTLEAILIPVASYVSEFIDRKIAMENGYDYVTSITSMSGYELHPLLFAVLLIGTPILTFTLFSFLNKRNSSDFYHSLPHTRVAIFVSKVTALMSCIIGMILLTSGISRLFAAFMPDIISVEPGTYLPYMIGCFAMCALIAACIIIGMSITGTPLSNAVVTLIVMFLPRVIIKCITLAVSARFPLVPEAYVSPLLSSDINILSGLLFSVEDSEPTVLLNAASQIYTVILALIYFVLGAVLFNRRRSESAERSAPSKFMQHVYRITVAMVICVPICYFVFTGNFDFTYDWFALLVLYIIVALVYFLYELITTRKWKNLIKALPGLAVVAALNLVLYGVMFGITAVERSYSPDADDIDYVQVVNGDQYVEGYFLTFAEYATNESSEVRISDPTVSEVVSESLKETIEFYDAHGDMLSYYDTYPYTSYVHPDIEPGTETYDLVTFKIKSGMTTKYRTLRVSQTDMDTIREALASSKEYTDVWMNLPQAQRGTVYAYTDGILSLDSNGGDALFKVMQKEVAGLDFETWYAFANSYDSVLGYVSYTTNGVEISVPFNAEVLPETTAAFYEIYNENGNEAASRVIEVLSENEEAYIESCSMCVLENGVYSCYSFDYDDHTSDEFREQLLEATYVTDISYGDTYLQVYVDIPLDYDEDETGEKYVSLDEYEIGVLKIKEEYVDDFLKMAR